MSCKKGGFVSVRHNDLRDLTTNKLSKVCKDVEIEPKLIALTGEVLGSSKHNEWSKTWHQSTWSLRTRTTNIFRFKGFWPQRLPLSQQIVATVSRNERTRKEKSIQWESFANWTWYVYTIGFFNLWNNEEGMPYVLFKIIRFTFRKTWFTEINNHELDTNKNMLCFDEIQLSLLKRLPNIEQKGCAVWEWCCCFWIYF